MTNVFAALKVDRTLPGCVCPPDEGLVAVACPVHFGDGYGHCATHAVDLGELRAAVGVRRGVPLCEDCARAFDHNSPEAA